MTKLLPAGLVSLPSAAEILESYLFSGLSERNVSMTLEHLVS
jgi:hypothetical protein